MLEARCPKCEAHYYGWALRFPRNQSCSTCGAALEIFEDGHQISEGYSPFKADKYSANQPPSVQTPSEKTIENE
jgi:hypothetical protein